MTTKASTKAKKLQVKIAYFMLAKRKVPTGVIANTSWYEPSKVWHLKEIRPKLLKEPHCTTCNCVNPIYVLTLCKGFEYDPTNWQYRSKPTVGELENKRPCKRCLASLSKIANTED